MRQLCERNTSVALWVIFYDQLNQFACFVSLINSIEMGDSADNTTLLLLYSVSQLHHDLFVRSNKGMVQDCAWKGDFFFSFHFLVLKNKNNPPILLEFFFCPLKFVFF